MKTLELIGEFIAAGLIVGAPFWVTWLYYLATGEYMDFR